MLNQFSRTQLLLGEDAMKRLLGSKVAVFGNGEAARAALEALVRSGVGSIDIFNGAEEFEARLRAINKKIAVNVADECAEDLSGYDYVIDASEDSDKTVEIANKAKGTEIISVMDMAQRMNVPDITVGDINKLKDKSVDKLRYDLRKTGVKKLRCVYSAEVPGAMDMPHVHMAAGLIAAGEVIKALSAVKSDT